MHCPNCGTSLPRRAVFCSFCGKRIPNKKKREQASNPLHAKDRSQIQNDATIRFPSLSQKHLARWQASHRVKNKTSSKQQQQASDLVQDGDVPVSIMLPPLKTEVPRYELLDAQTLIVTSAPEQATQRNTDSHLALTDLLQHRTGSKNSATWLWPAIIIFSAITTALAIFVFPAISLRPLIVFWFLLVCPGMVFVRFLRLNEPVVEWTLAIALSFAIDSIVAALFLYAGKWSPPGVLTILLSLSFAGAIIQLVTKHFALSIS